MSSLETESSHSAVAFFNRRDTFALFTPGAFFRLRSMFEAHEAQCIPTISIFAFFIFHFLLLTFLFIGLFQYGDLQCGQTVGVSLLLAIHLWEQRSQPHAQTIISLFVIKKNV